ncbi:(2Fe-2S)-binding protein [Streptomyces sudanensis]|uniref:(2Fe-2S)-binding protein n=1 Tax=Streptomyces sudanensis TaxID=436397 RepID=UPI0020CE6B0E|nr:(2Fe-2S)-binding protein [Streptomyces sudanensis]MCP9956384.1 (2Fe-2S)-binding protein [Streptomyces sudanensis]MCQ0002998.1 (2Fe-2S)-binding protein [Streptomyces sudanensis]
MGTETRGLTAAELRAVGGVGGFFVLPGAPPGPGPYAPLALAYAPGPDSPLAVRVARVAEALRTPEYRVAASLVQLGLAARLWSVTLGAAALHGVFPDVSPGTLHWDPARSAPDELWWPGTAARPGTVRELRDAVQYGHLVPLGEALRAAGPVSPRLLWGNAGSALGGAVREITRWSRRHGRPDAAGRAAELAAGLLDHPDLAGTLRGPAMRRRTCCLYYRCPGGGLCGDCVFDTPPGAPPPARVWRAAGRLRKVPVPERGKRVIEERQRP